MINDIVYLNVGDLFRWRDEETILEATTSNLQYKNNLSPIGDINRGYIRAKEHREPIGLTEVVNGIPDFLYHTNQITLVNKEV